MIATLLPIFILLQSTNGFSQTSPFAGQRRSIMASHFPTHHGALYEENNEESDLVEKNNGNPMHTDIVVSATPAEEISSTSTETIDNTSEADFTLTSRDLAQEIISKVNTDESTIHSSPPLSFPKYLTMQEKRVNVTIRFSATPGLQPYYLTIAKKIKESNSDVIVEKVILPTAEDKKFLQDTVFEVLIDGKVIIGKSRGKFQGVRRSMKQEVNDNQVFGMSVYVSMEEVNGAIGKARKKRRPNTVYTPEDRQRSMGLEK